MTSSEPETPPEALGPDPVPENKNTVYDRYERWFIALFLLLIALGGYERWGRDRTGFRPISIERGEESLGMGAVDWSKPIEPLPLESKNLNEVDRSDLLALPGIGPALATSILESGRRKDKFGEADLTT